MMENESLVEVYSRVFSNDTYTLLCPKDLRKPKFLLLSGLYPLDPINVEHVRKKLNFELLLD